MLPRGAGSSLRTTTVLALVAGLVLVAGVTARADHCPGHVCVKGPLGGRLFCTGSCPTDDGSNPTPGPPPPPSPKELRCRRICRADIGACKAQVNARFTCTQPTRGERKRCSRSRRSERLACASRIIQPCLGVRRAAACPTVGLAVTGSSSQTTSRAPTRQYLALRVRAESRNGTQPIPLAQSGFNLVADEPVSFTGMSPSTGIPSTGCATGALPPHGSASCALLFEVGADVRAAHLTYSTQRYSVRSPTFALPSAKPLAPPLELVIRRVVLASAVSDVFTGFVRPRPLHRFADLDLTLVNHDYVGLQADGPFFRFVSGAASIAPEPSSLSEGRCDGFFDDVAPLAWHLCSLRLQLPTDAASGTLVFDDGRQRGRTDVSLPSWPASDPSGSWSLVFGAPDGVTCSAEVGQRLAPEGTTMLVRGRCGRQGDRLDLDGTIDHTTLEVRLSARRPPFCPQFPSGDATVTATVAADGGTLTGTFTCAAGASGAVTATRSAR